MKQTNIKLIILNLICIIEKCKHKLLFSMVKRAHEENIKLIVLNLILCHLLTYSRQHKAMGRGFVLEMSGSRSNTEKEVVQGSIVVNKPVCYIEVTDSV